MLPFPSSSGDPVGGSISIIAVGAPNRVAPPFPPHIPAVSPPPPPRNDATPPGVDDTEDIEPTILLFEGEEQSGRDEDCEEEPSITLLLLLICFKPGIAECT